jgi:ABC-type spermidine/putrescine transport system permease subunit I
MLLTLPAFLGIVLLKHSVSASKIVFQFLPAIATGVVGVSLVVPLLSGGVQHAVAGNVIWQQFMRYQEFALVVGVFGSVVVAAISSRHKEGHHKKGGHH